MPPPPSPPRRRPRIVLLVSQNRDQPLAHDRVVVDDQDPDSLWSLLRSAAAPRPHSASLARRAADLRRPPSSFARSRMPTSAVAVACQAGSRAETRGRRRAPTGGRRARRDEREGRPRSRVGVPADVGQRFLGDPEELGFRRRSGKRRLPATHGRAPARRCPTVNERAKPASASASGLPSSGEPLRRSAPSAALPPDFPAPCPAPAARRSRA